MPHLINLSNSDLDSDANFDGYEAYDASGEKVGDIDGVIADEQSMQPRYVVVDAGGWFSQKQYVVPAGELRQIDDDQRKVHFKSLTKETLKGGRYPKYDDSWWESNDHQKFSSHEQELATAYQPGRPKGSPVDYSSEMYQRPAEGAQRLQLLEERLKVNKERYQAGDVRIGKHITEQDQTVNVPLREERVVIERRAGSGQVVADGKTIGDNETIEVPVMAERADVTKEAVVAEEISIRKESTERTEQVRETVRREELDVEGDQQFVSGAGDGATLPNQPRGTDTHSREKGGKMHEHEAVHEHDDAGTRRD